MDLEVALAIFGSMSLITAFTRDFQSLLAARLLQGLGLGAEVPLAALFNQYVRGKSRGTIVMLYESAFTRNPGGMPWLQLWGGTPRSRGERKPGAGTLVAGQGTPSRAPVSARTFRTECSAGCAEEAFGT